MPRHPNIHIAVIAIKSSSNPPALRYPGISTNPFLSISTHIFLPDTPILSQPLKCGLSISSCSLRFPPWLRLLRARTPASWVDKHAMIKLTGDVRNNQLRVKKPQRTNFAKTLTNCVEPPTTRNGTNVFSHKPQNYIKSVMMRLRPVL